MTWRGIRVTGKCMHRSVRDGEGYRIMTMNRAKGKCLHKIAKEQRESK